MRENEVSYNRSYEDGMAGRPFDRTTGEDYEDGWYDGESDRPTMDDFVDVEKERVDPLGY